MAGPLTGVRVIELGAIGPAPFAGMLLGDLGAEVIRVARHGDDAAAQRAVHGVLLRGRRFVQADLKAPGGAELVRRLVQGADVLTEGFRPGVAERLGIGPDDLLAGNPRLVYGRMTGWGQDGPLAASAGHDINYIALSGALAPCVGSDGAPVAPLNMLGDFGGGGMLLAVGVLAALLHARATGEGQVVDAAIVDGSALLTAMHQAMLGSGLWAAPPGGNIFDGGAPFYGVYRTADDRWLSVGAIEPAFYADFVRGLGMPGLPDRDDPANWPQLKQQVAARIAERSLEEWTDAFAGLEACVAPVLDPAEAPDHPQLAAREVYREWDGLRHPAPAPRFSATTVDWPPTAEATDSTYDVLREIGCSTDELDQWTSSGVITAAPKGDQE
ncbi:CoA transferase [Calidifontibacter sp. DB0510]|uniref:CoA transferase n=1 Tax=Metallococcus carri TaxID=1656884 RepID=A0A967B174_9MICO|nr:CaiB/BaiF CoA-transferase family protein [Metallococcus carri]NHN55588.1 CoA transferase [Metallococcus carri]NOP38228.1 CoA transferase [Calidifontibacter sp. DB2511S]